jgi:hypothetical protein
LAVSFHSSSAGPDEPAAFTGDSNALLSGDPLHVRYRSVQRPSTVDALPAELEVYEIKFIVSNGSVLRVNR